MARLKKQTLNELDPKKILPGLRIENKTTKNRGKIISFELVENKWHSKVEVEWEWGGRSKVNLGVCDSFIIV